MRLWVGSSSSDRLRLVRGRTFVGALAGAIIAAALWHAVSFRASPFQLPGHASSAGFDPRGDVVRLALMAACPILGGYLAARRHRSLVVAQEGDPRSSTVRKFRFDFLTCGAEPSIAALSTSYGILLLVVGTRLCNDLGLAPFGALALPITGALAVVGASLRLHGRDGAVSLAGACPVLVLALVPSVPRLALLVGTMAALLLPFVSAAARKGSPGLERLFRILSAGVLLPGSITALAASLELRHPRVIDLFEDGHALLPANVYLAGGLPYRDILPLHGLAVDGLLQFGLFLARGADYGVLRGCEMLTGLLFWPAVYLLALAATRSVSTAYWSLALSFLCFPQYAFGRATVSVATVALVTVATLQRRPRIWIAAGMSAVLGFLVAVDFAGYATVALAAGLLVSRGSRTENARRALLGAGATAVMVLAFLQAFGIATGFLVATFGLVPSLLPVYALGFPSLTRPPDAANGPWRSTVALYLFAMLGVTWMGATIGGARGIGQRARAAVPTMAWIAAAMLAVLDRQHVEYPLLLAPTACVLLGRWCWRTRGSLGLAVGVPVAACLGLLVTAKGGISFPEQMVARPRIPDAYRPRPEWPRTRGAVVHDSAARVIAQMSRAMSLRQFGVEDTWFDFSNAPGLYFVLNRRCPTRLYQVPFFEAERDQLEVVHDIENDHRVRLALVAAGLPNDNIDGIGNSVRAPIVWRYLTTEFEPFLSDGVVSIWVRKADKPGVSSR